MINTTPEPRELAEASGSTHSGELRIPGDSTSSSVMGEIAFTDDRRLVVTSAGMLLAEWSIADVVIESVGPVTTIGCHGDVLIFDPSDEDAWSLQIAAHELRSRLTTSQLVAPGDVTMSRGQNTPRADTVSPVARQGAQVVQVMQNTAVRTPRRTTHWLHLLLTVLTFGVWLPVWIGVSVFTGVANARSSRTSTALAPQSWTPSRPPALNDPSAVGTRNRSFLIKVGVGLGVILLLSLFSAVASNVEVSDPEVPAETPTTEAAPREAAVTDPDLVVSAPTAAPLISPADLESGEILVGTSGTLRAVLVDLMDTTSCDDLEFDLKFATDNYAFNSAQASRVLRAVDYAQEYGIGGATCSGLDPHLDTLIASG